MNMEFKIDTWLAESGGSNESEETRKTLAALQILLGDRVATRVADDLSKSTRDMIFVSAYPLALWFAASWWRLRWEPASDRHSAPDISWRMAHEMVAVGGGFIWPRLTFAFDGESVEVNCERSSLSPVEPVRYLDGFRTFITTNEFESAIDGFVSTVLSRLNSIGMPNTELGSLWNEVLAERQNKTAARYRRWEAILGYEPDEAPEAIISRIERLSETAGEASVAEIAPACATENPENPGKSLDRVIDLAGTKGVEARVNQSDDLASDIHKIVNAYNRPWERGWHLARLARSHWNLSTERVLDHDLSQILDVETHVFMPVDEGDRRKPIGLAIRNGASDRLNLLFRRPTHEARRFEAARFLADYLVAPIGDNWLPATDEKTVRQKVQRAFAAEFLCPLDALQGYLGSDFSDEAINDAGDYFKVSPLTVRSHLQNNHLLSRML
jgi:hypothetical protein